MFAINKQIFNYDEDSSWYNSGYKLGTTKIFLSSLNVLNYFKTLKDNLYIEYYKGLTQINLDDNIELNHFLSTTTSTNSDNEFILYQIDINELEEDQDYLDNKDIAFYNTFNFKEKTVEEYVSEKYIFRIVCKRVEEGEEIWFNETEQNEPNNKSIVKSLENKYSTRLSTKDYMFRLELEMEDLFYYWNKENQRIDFTLPIQIPDSEEVKYVTVLEIAFWIIKNTSCKDTEYIIWDFMKKSEFNLEFYNELKMNTLFPDYTLEEVINECCGEEDKVDLNNLLKRLKKKK